MTNTEPPLLDNAELVERLLSGEELAEQRSMSPDLIDWIHASAARDLKNGHATRAVEALRYLCAHCHNRQDFWHGLGLALVAARRPLDALSAYAVTIELGANPQNCLDLARCWLALGRPTQAAEAVALGRLAASAKNPLDEAQYKGVEKLLDGAATASAVPNEKT